MSSMKKKIAINPSLFQIGKKNKTTKNKEKKEKPKALISPNVMKKQLLAKIKEHQRQNQNNNYRDQKKSVKGFSDDFSNSLNYLSDLVKEKNNNAKFKPTITSNEVTNESNDFPQQLMVQTPMAQTPMVQTPMIQTPMVQAPMVQTPMVQTPMVQTPMMQTPMVQTPMVQTPMVQTPMVQTPVPISQEPFEIAPINTPLLSDPPYGCLKNASKPTYRNWMNSNLSQNDINNIQSRQEKLQSLKDNFNPDKKQNFILKRTIKKKYTLGRSKKKNTISVLIKGNNLRKKITHEKHALTKKNMLDVKRFLKKHGLIKAGTTCPNDVLREMYQSAVLTGYVSNKNTENLIHNYINS